MSAIQWIGPLAASTFLAGCGLFTPEMEEFYEPQSIQKLFENTIINNVKCELTKVVQEAVDKYDPDTPGMFKQERWLRSWGALVTFKLTVDEKSGLGPSVNFTPIPSPFSLALGASGTADATRTETIAFSYAFSDLLKENKRHPLRSCTENENGVFIKSDLKIGQFIENKTFVASVPGTTLNPPTASPYSTFSYDITFVASYGGTANPAWTFTRVAVDSGTLLTATRTRTHEITITLGPVVVPATSKAAAQLSPTAQDIHLSTLIGNSVATR
jgi:hypothetical protein